MNKRLICLLCCFLFLFPTLSFAKVITLQSSQTLDDAVFTIHDAKHQIPDWGITDTNVQKWWKQGYTGKGTKIAILDTGINAGHPDLRPAIKGGASFVKGENYWVDYFGHGTHVAGIIAAQNNKIGSVGVAYNANLYIVKVIGKNGEGNVSDVIKGIQWSIDHHMDIINMSFALTDDEKSKPTFKQLESVINQAYAKGILLVAASGNDGVNHVDYPANFKNVIAVGGMYDGYNTKEKHGYLGWADFSNYSSKIEVVAPSVYVYSTFPFNLTPEMNGYKGYEYESGTSMAVPNVVGFLALLKQRYPHDSNVQLRNLLHKNTKPIIPKSETGYGMIYAK